jgi:hypothetical protein
MIEQLQEALKTDEGYRLSWQANIAMAFVDAFKSHQQKVGRKHVADQEVHKVANDAADNFLNTLCL